MAGRSRFLAGRFRFAAGWSRFVAGRKNNKSGTKCGARADSRPGPRTKGKAISKDISEKKNNLSGQTLKGALDH